MTYVCPSREFAADIHLLQLQSLQNRVLRITGKLIHDMHMAFQIPYVYDYTTKSCGQQAQVIQNHENAHVHNIGHPLVQYCAHVHNIGQGDARQRKYKRLKICSTEPRLNEA
jgi:hypothetical protein